VIRALSHWRDRAVAFAYVNPNHLEFSLRELDRCIGDGPMVGVKLWVAKRCGSPEVDAIVERAMKCKVVDVLAEVDCEHQQACPKRQRGPLVKGA
jgi:hypothetical protein